MATGIGTAASVGIGTAVSVTAPKPVPKPVGPGKIPTPVPVDPATQSSWDQMKSTLEAWGLGTLYDQAKKLMVSGLNTADEWQLALSQTDEWKKRFAGNAVRLKNGLSALTPGQYLAAEQAYHETYREFGLPEGFYDSKADTDAYIGAGVSGQEMSDRVKAASDVVNGDPNTLAAWNQFYGGGTGGAIAAILDPTKASTLVQQEALAAGIGGSALSAGLTTNATQAMRIAQHGVGLAQARAAYGDIAARASSDHSNSARFGMTFTQTDEEDANLLDVGAAKSKAALINSEEAAQFGGHGGASAQSNSAAANY